MNLGFKVISLATGALAGLVARQVVSVIWEKGLGQETPTGNDIEDMNLPLMRVAAFTAVTAGVTSLVNEAMQRKTAEWYGLRDKLEIQAEQAKSATKKK